MDQGDERLIEEVRKYEHLYNSSMENYKDYQMSTNSWREIAQNLGLEVAECMRRWKSLRDKYVRLRKKMATRSGDPGGQKVPAFFHFMSWLAPHVKHRETESNYEAKTLRGSPESETASTVSTSPTEPPESVTSGVFAPPAAPMPPVSSPVESPVSRPKRMRVQQKDQCEKDIASLHERRMEIHQKIKAIDEYSRFGETVADMLRRTPEDQRPGIMYKIHGVFHGQ